jgi:hypothetical protein
VNSHCTIPYCIVEGTQKPTTQPSEAPPTNPSSATGDGPTPDNTIKYGLQDDCNIDDPSKYDICLDLKSNSGGIEPWMDSFSLARAKWQSVIVDDDGDAVELTIDDNFIATERPDMVDDVYISASVVTIDGPGGILGSAGTKATKVDSSGNVHALAGRMRFDEADVQNMINSGAWNNVILHEIGHILGIGTLWNNNGLYSGSNGNYLGLEGIGEWELMGCAGIPPVETDGGSGTAGGHWDETCLRGELMTGYLSGGMQLSRLTIALLKDMGHGVDLNAADDYPMDLLGACGEYCPAHARQLHVGRQARPLAEKKGKVSKEGHATILAAAAKEMQEAHDMRPRDLPDGMTYVADQFITIYIEDTDGEVKEETVTWEDTRGFRELNEKK